jgi:hypothetical protein
VRAPEYPGLSVQKTSKPGHAPTEITSVFRLRLRSSVGDFAFATSHRLTTGSLVAGTLNSAGTCPRHLPATGKRFAAFSIADASSSRRDGAQP